MSTITWRFEKVTWKGRQRGNCRVCGKMTRREKTFSQTLNPFNKNKERDRPKTWREIEIEVRDEARAWSKETPICATCEWEQD